MCQLVMLCSYVVTCLLCACPLSPVGTQTTGGIFYPVYSTEHSHSILPINVSVEHTETCSVDAVVTFSLVVHNSSAVFLDEVMVDLSAVTSLPQVHISRSVSVHRPGL